MEAELSRRSYDANVFPPLTCILILCPSVCCLFLNWLAQTSGYVTNLVLPAPPTVNISGTTISRILVIPTNGFTGKIDFACMITGPSPQPTCATPPSVTVTNGAGAASAATVTFNNNTAVGTFTITVNATSGGMPPANGAQSVPVSHTNNYDVTDGGGGIALLTFSVLLVLWSTTRLWRKGADLR